MRYRVNGMFLRALRTAPLLLLCLASCKKEGSTPSFLRIVDPQVTTPSGDTVLTSAITDIWVYAKGEPVGVWQPDRRIPIIASGPSTITLIAGVRRNGISDDRVQYPFIATFQEGVDLVLGEEVELAPTFHYYENAPWVQDFESVGLDFDLSESDTVFCIIDSIGANPEVRSGAYAGVIALDPEHDHFRALSIADPPFPAGGGPAFLEMDVRGDTRLLVGVRVVQGGQIFTVPYVFVTPTNTEGALTWKHVYIDLRTAWGTGALDSRAFFLEANLEGGATSARIAVDNLRVYY